MKNFSLHCFSLISLFCATLSTAVAQESVLYLTVLSNKSFTVGMANPMTGLYRVTGDTSFVHLGATNIRASDCDITERDAGRTLFIASGNGLQRSTDAGATWRIMTDWRITELRCVTVDQRDPMKLYITTPYGIWISTDGGARWRQANDGLDSKFVSRLIIDRDDSSILYCSTESGAYRGTNGGGRWTKLLLNASGIRTIAQSKSNPSILAAGTEEDGIYVSTDRGATWEQRRAGVVSRTFYSVEFDPRDANVIYAAGYATGMYKSIDGGVTWSRKNSGLDCASIHSIAIDPFDTRRVYAGSIGRGVFLSEDAGETWKNIGLPDAQIWSMRFLGGGK